MKLLDGKQTSEALLIELRAQVGELRQQHGITPGLAVVLVGEDPASQVYVRNKVRTAKELGIASWQHTLPKATTQTDLLTLVRQLNDDPAVHGILVQSPPPPQIDERAIIEALDPAKDVDCFHPTSVGRLTIGDEDGFLPCTPHGVMVLLRRHGVATAGKLAVILGRSNIVGKPLALLLARKGAGADCTVMICHSRTPDLGHYTRQADILVAAIGRPELVRGPMVKEGAVVVDVGINRVDDPAAKRGYRLVGDVAYDEVAPRCSWITPVPGGVGPMTIAMLMHNAVKAACLRHGLPVPKLA